MWMKHALMDQAGGDGGAGAGGAAGAGQQQGAAGAGSGQPPAAFDWKGAGLDDGAMALVTERQWKSPGDLLTSYRNLEKLTGAPADQIIRLPKDDKPESWGPIYDRLGRPKTADEYSLPVPEGDKGEFAKVASGWFHELGLSGKQARAVAEKWNAHVAAQLAAQTEATRQRDVEQVAQLKAAWGPQFEANALIVDNVAKKFGMTPEHLDALKQAMGPAAAMKFMHAIGTGMGVEGEFVGPDGKATGSGFGMTPEQAQAKIQALRNDPAFAKRFASQDQEAREEMRRLHKLAYPGDTVL